MSAIKFIQQHGVEKAREAITDHPRYANFVWIYNDRITYGVSGFSGAVNLADLKRLVESVDLVNSYGGVQESEWEISSQDDLPEYCYRLRQAIDDYESIYGGGHV